MLIIFPPDVNRELSQPYYSRWIKTCIKTLVITRMYIILTKCYSNHMYCSVCSATQELISFITFKRVFYALYMLTSNMRRCSASAYPCIALTTSWVEKRSTCHRAALGRLLLFLNLKYGDVKRNSVILFGFGLLILVFLTINLN